MLNDLKKVQPNSPPKRTLQELFPKITEFHRSLKFTNFTQFFCSNFSDSTGKERILNPLCSTNSSSKPNSTYFFERSCTTDRRPGPPVTISSSSGPGPVPGSVREAKQNDPTGTFEPSPSEYLPSQLLPGGANAAHPQHINTGT